jgi:predicted metal-dependent hydrolase
MSAPVVIKAHAKARALTLRYQPHRGQFLLTTPRRIAQRHIDAFIIAQQDWMIKQQSLYPQTQNFSSGGQILYLGKNYRLSHTEGAGVTITLDDSTFHITCRATRLERVIIRFLQSKAVETLSALAHEKAARLGRTIPHINFRDTKSRWGSCGRDGRLCFSWRLVMAPPEVIDYVVAHEVAHLIHFDHSKEFWALCRSLSDSFTFGKHWLQQHAATLHQYG